MRVRTGLLWLAWGLGAVGASAYLGLTLDRGADRTVFLPGATSDGHHQIEIACEACHGEAFAGPEVMQQKCESCHLEALDEARDSHPRSKFTDPRNADRAALLDARFCVTCHVEHRPDRTVAMGLTIPEDYCVLCHAEIGAERPTHERMAFDTCASSGCHNFHDNRSIYEDFLLRHAGAPDLLPSRELPARNYASIAALLSGYPNDRYPIVELGVSDADAPTSMPAATDQWADTAHARNGVNCTACHTVDNAESGAESGDGLWVDTPGYDVCGNCHNDESGRFYQGRHGMRLDVSRLGRVLSPMTPAASRLPMKADPLADELNCGSCHGAHQFDTAYAAVDACLGCHDDTHSQAYIGSPHHRLVERAREGTIAPEAGVTCASCHMPRTSISYDYGAYIHVLVDHNQSDNLRPNDKMIRSVCLECHGLGFSIDALADRDLIERNFDGQPALHVESIDLALERRRAVDLERRRSGEGDD